jgi:DNA-binding NarL/FixJ family response regulator
VRIAVLTVLEADENMLCALKAGARGYVLKCVGAAELVSALRWVFDRRSGRSDRHFVGDAFSPRRLVERRAPQLAHDRA